MNRTNNTGFVVAALLVAGALALGLRSTSTETDVHPHVTLPPAADESAIVVQRIESGGFSLFGLQFGTVAHTIGVQFYAPPGCFDQVASGDPWPVPFDDCTGPIPITGIIAGGGIAVTGESIIMVEFEVSADCFEAISLGSQWPPAGCALPA